MPDNLTRTAVVEDCLNLMLASDHICEAFKEVCREHFHFAMFGGLAQPDGHFPIQLLDQYRNQWDSHRTVKEEVGFRSAPLVPKTKAESVLSFVLGWVCYQAADRLLQPESSEAGLYRDAYIFHRLFVNNNNTPTPYRTALYVEKMDHLRPSETITSHDTAELFRVLQQRFFIEMHTFVPDVEDIEGWFDRLYVRMQEYRVNSDRLAEAVMNPDPAKAREYVTDTNFYHDEDAIIQLSVAIRRGSNPSQAEFDAALAAEPQSQYARALKQGFDNLMNANAFFTGSMDQRKFIELLAV